MNLKSAIESIDAKSEGLVILEQNDINNIHKVLLGMLKDFNDLCIENQIEWSLAGGSILGAIRHQGFIPWDDDVDIHMKRKDFEKLHSLLQTHPSECFDLKTPGDPGYIFHFPKLYKKGTVFREIQSNDENPNQIFMDIFILEDIPNSKLQKKIHGFQCEFFLLVVSALRVYACKETMLKYSSHNEVARKEILKRCKIAKFFRFRSLQWWLKRADQCFSKYHDDTTILLGDPTGAGHYFRELYRREIIGKQKIVKFENLQLPVPIKAEELLCQRYGDDYMVLPPMNKRGKHAIIELRTNEGECNI